MKKLLKVSFLLGGLWLIICFCQFALTSCAHILKDTNEFGAINLERAIDNLVIIETKAMIKDQIDPAVLKAIAIPIGNGLIVTLSHATTTKPFVRMRTPFGLMEFPREIISEKWFIGETEAKLIGRKNDISVFKADILQEFPYEFGDSDRLRVGDKLVMVGYPFGLVILVKQGVVALPDYLYEDEHYLLVNILTNMGDSGSPILTYQDNTLKIVGILAKRFGQDGLGSAYPSNYIQKTIAEILEGKNDLL